LAIVLLSANVNGNNDVCLFGLIWKKKKGRKKRRVLNLILGRKYR
jgi:hypothetical protein